MAMSTETVSEFRAELRRWLATHLTDDMRRERIAQLPEAERITQLRAWQARLAADRWVAITWPTEYGGRSASIAEQIAYVEEMSHADAPEIINNLGIGIVGPPILAYGTEEQKQRFAHPQRARPVVLWLLRARRRLRSRLAAHHCHPRRRRVRAQRTEGLDDLR